MKTARHVDVRTEGIYDKDCCQEDVSGKGYKSSSEEY